MVAGRSVIASPFPFDLPAMRNGTAGADLGLVLATDAGH
jgi:hypothetical protein